MPRHRDHRILSLTQSELRTFLDAEERHLARAPIDREGRAVLAEIDRVVAPFAGRNHAAVEIENTVELAPVEGDRKTARQAAQLSDPRGRAGALAEERYCVIHHRVKLDPVWGGSQAPMDSMPRSTLAGQHHTVADGGERHVDA